MDTAQRKIYQFLTLVIVTAVVVGSVVPVIAIDPASAAPVEERPDIEMEPTSLDFESVPIGQNSSQNVTISNTGNATATVTGAVLDGPSASAFMITNTTVVNNTSVTNGTSADELSFENGTRQAFELAPNTSQNLTVDFAPETAGEKTAALSIESSATDEREGTVSLSGSGVAPVETDTATTENDTATAENSTESANVTESTTNASGSAEEETANGSVVGNNSSEPADGNASTDPDGGINTSGGSAENATSNFSASDENESGSGENTTVSTTENTTSNNTSTSTASDTSTRNGSETTVAVSASAAGPTGMAGSGTEADPYVVTDATQLQAMNGDMDAHYVLMNDIDASETAEWNDGEGFDPIGQNLDTFSGMFNGNGHTITGLEIDRESEEYVGLFGLTYDATIKNVRLSDVDVTGNEDVGGLVGRNIGKIFGSSVTGDVTGSSSVGGLVGTNQEDRVGGNDVKIHRSHSTADISGGGEYTGGLVGRNEVYRGQNNVVISESYATGTVISTNSFVGGLVGQNEGTISGSYATGTVTGDQFVGGLVGQNGNGENTDAAISGTYATGTVSIENRYGGGLVGRNYGGSVSKSYWNTETTDQSDSAGSPNSHGFTTTEMTGVGAVENMDGFDFSKTWAATNGYPLLRSQADDGAPLFTVEIVNVSSPVAPGEVLSTTVNIQNVGVDRSTTSVGLAFNGGEIGSAPESPTPGSVTLDGGDSNSVSLGGTIPENTDTGEYTMTVTVDGDKATKRIDVAVPDIDVVSTNLSFDDVRVGENDSKNVTVTNEGDAPLSVTTNDLAGENASAFAVTNDSSFEMGPSATRDIPVEFAPSTIGSKRATLIIGSNDPDTPQVDVTLKGEGVAPETAVKPQELSFGNLTLGANATKTVTITNDGTTPLNVTNISVGGSDTNAFAATGDSGPFTLAVNQSRTLSVEFSPISTGQKNATLDIESNDTDEGTVEVVLAGVGMATVDECMVITHPGRYELTENVTNSSVDRCIEIQSSNVTFDGNEYTVDGDGTVGAVGIYAADKPGHPIENVTVTNVTIKGWKGNNPDSGFGIRFRETIDGEISNVIATGNDHGIGFFGRSTTTGTTNNTVADNILTDNEVGILLEAFADNNTVADNTITANEHSGIEISRSTGNSIAGNLVTDNGKITDQGGFSGEGILLLRSSDTDLRNNTVSNNTQGISLSSESDNNDLANNRVNNNTLGISLVFNSSNNTLSDTVVQNSGVVIMIRAGSAGNTINRMDIGRSTAAHTTLSFEGQNMFLRAAESPSSNSVAESIGRYFIADNIGNGELRNLELHYKDGDIAENEENDLSLWKHANGEWSQLNSSIDSSNNVVSVNEITNFSTFGAFRTLEPASLTIDGIEANSSVVAGESLTVNATLNNIGELVGIGNVSLAFDGKEVANESVTVEGGDEKIIPLEFSISNDTSAGSYTVTVSVEGDEVSKQITVVKPEIAISETELVFGNRTVGTNASQDVTVTNDGSAPLNVTNVSIKGPDANAFAVTGTSSPFTIAPNETQTMSVTFAPTAVGEKNASLDIESTDTDEGIVKVALAGVGTSNVDECTIITQPGRFQLSGNITDSSTDACIDIRSSDVIFDGNDFTIDGDGDSSSVGVSVHNHTERLTNVTVQNVTTSDWNDVGVQFRDTDGGRVVATNTNNVENGIVLSDADSSELTANTLHATEQGIIHTDESDDSVVTDNTVTGTSNGIVVQRGSNNTLQNNTITNSSVGILLSEGGNNTVAENTVTGNTDGIVLVSTTTNTLIENTAAENTNGVLVFLGDNNTLRDHAF